jgi:hypothetical protein
VNTRCYQCYSYRFGCQNQTRKLQEQENKDTGSISKAYIIHHRVGDWYCSCSVLQTSMQSMSNDHAHNARKHDCLYNQTGQHISTEDNYTAYPLTELKRMERHQRKFGGLSSTPTMGVPVRTVLDMAMACRPLRVLSWTVSEEHTDRGRTDGPDFAAVFSEGGRGRNRQGQDFV